MFTVQRSASAPSVIPNDLLQMIAIPDRMVIEQVARNPALRSTLRAMQSYSKGAVERAIDRGVVERFASLGIFGFGNKVKDAKIHIIDFLNRHPELRDSDPNVCFAKIVYYIGFCAHNNVQMD